MWFAIACCFIGKTCRPTNGLHWLSTAALALPGGCDHRYRGATPLYAQPEGLGNGFDIAQRDISSAALNAADVGTVEIASGGKFFLRQPSFAATFSHPPQIVGKAIYRPCLTRERDWRNFASGLVDIILL